MRPLVFTQVSIIDATGAPLQAGMTIVIRWSHCECGEKRSSQNLARRSDCCSAGKVFSAGLVGHACPPRYRRLRQTGNALSIANGVTGIRIMDGDPAFHEWRAEISAGTLLGPRMVIGVQFWSKSDHGPSGARSSKTSKTRWCGFCKSS